MNIRDASPLRNKETFLGALLLVFSGLFLLGVAAFPDTASRYRSISPSFFPNLLGTALAVLSLFLVVEGIRKKPSPIFNLQTSKRNMIRAGLLLGGLIVFMVLFRILGFALMAFVFAAVSQVILGERRILKMLIVAFAVTAVLYILFVVLLRVPFPAGILFK